MLSPYRVLDLSDHRGGPTGYILGSLGAEVIVVEPPGGSEGRRRPPLGPDGMSLEWWSMRRGAKSVIVDGVDELMELVSTADVLIESPDPGQGLVTEDLHAVNPSLVHTTITPFGTTGPKAGYLASDLIIGAAGCAMAVTGDSDRAPLRISVPQAWMHAGGQAAAGTALALRARSASGLGQHVDVSAQQAMLQAGFPGIILAPNDFQQTARASGGILLLNYHLQFVYPTLDGSVSITLLFGDTIGRFTARLMDWVFEEGHCDEAMRDADWIEFGLKLFTDPGAAEELEAAKAAITSFTSTRSKAELFAEAQERRVLLAPVTTAEELVGIEHFIERGYWDEQIYGGVGAVALPGAWVKPSGGPLPRLGPAPALDQHRGEVGWAHDPILPTVPEPVGPSDRPLDGLKVLDTSWVYAGPFATRLLADMGATVIKVEGPTRFDASRSGGGGLKGDLGPDAGIQFGTLNAGKKGVTLNLNVKEGQEAFRDLCDWADVLVESYTPGTMDQWGLGFDTLQKTNPRLVMLSTSLMGHSGPLSTFAGFGNLAGAITGFYEVTGWPDRPRAGPFLAYTDYVVPSFMVSLIVAALEQRDRQGVGQHLDFAQAEAAIHFLASAVLEYTVNGVAPSALGNDDRFICPHVVVPAEGEDRWVAVACETDDQWERLASVLGRDDLANLDLEGRVELKADLEELIATWVRTRSMEVAQDELQSCGVPAHAVQNSAECFADPQLIHRGHWVTVEHPVHDEMIVEATRFQLSRTPALVTRSGPSLGEHNDEVLRGVLGYDDERIAELAVAGAIG